MLLTGMKFESFFKKEYLKIKKECYEINKKQTVYNIGTMLFNAGFFYWQFIYQAAILLFYTR